jgi:hypothetical protein
VELCQRVEAARHRLDVAHGSVHVAHLLPHQGLRGWLEVVGGNWFNE